MAEYIERKALKQYLLDKSFYPAIVKGALESLPAVDVVEVVRCKKCQHRYTTRCALWVSTVNDDEIFREHGDDFFCSFGKRKDGAE